MRTILSIFLVLIGVMSYGQQPVSWQFSAKKMEDKKYEVTMKATVNPPWHIYSQTTPDGGPLATTISFNKNPLVELNNEVKEVGAKVTKYEEVFGVNVIYYNGNVSFVQEVKVKAKVKTNISGVIEYMVCNDTQCLPPVKVPFTIAIK